MNAVRQRLEGLEGWAGRLQERLMANESEARVPVLLGGN